jgi:hypothetical protein
MSALARTLHALLVRRVAGRRLPDLVIGERGRPYLCRWYILPRNRWCNAYLHQFWRSDDDRALHDHPWWSLSLCLSGSMVEHTIAAGGVHHRRFIAAGGWRLRSARLAHRLELDENAGPVWTLFLTGPRLRQWGFHCPQGWVPWEKFTAGTTDDLRGQVGRGCG